MYLQVNCRLKKGIVGKILGFSDKCWPIKPKSYSRIHFQKQNSLVYDEGLTYLESYIRKNSWILTAQLSFKGSASAHSELEN